MSSTPSARVVSLIDNRAPERALCQAELARPFPAAELSAVDASWRAGRADVNDARLAGGLPRLEHSHWEWQRKAGSVRAGRHVLVAVRCEGAVQGLMAVLQDVRPARLDKGGHVVYVDYLESAPWNLKLSPDPPRFLGVGTVLMAEAVRISREKRLGGRVGLHSLPQAETFYSQRCQMTLVGPDPGYENLTYFEYTTGQVDAWMASIGESL
jgi:hypothetical protein